MSDRVLSDQFRKGSEKGVDKRAKRDPRLIAIAQFLGRNAARRDFKAGRNKK